MPTEKLTEAFVKNATAEPGQKRTIYWDETLPRFGLRVMHTGHKAYLVQYRAGKGRAGKDCKEVLGTAGPNGSKTLAEARKEARKKFGQVADGRNPLAERRAAAARATNTLQYAIENFFAIECGMKRDESGKAVFPADSDGKPRMRTAPHRLRTLERLVYPTLGSMPVHDVKRSHLVRLLDQIADKHGEVMSDRTLAYLRKVLNWHAIRNDDYVCPIVKGMTRATGRSRDRMLDDAELKAVWEASANAGPFGSMVRFILLTSARRAEASRLVWDEITGADWKLPARRNKTRVNLIRPLPQAARDLLAGMPTYCRYVFTNDGETAIAGYSKFKTALQKASGTSGWSIHDLRRTAKSLMSRARVPTEYSEHVLGHMLPGMKRVYDQYKYHAEKAEALEKLAGMIDSIVNPPATNVLAFPAAR